MGYQLSNGRYSGSRTLTFAGLAGKTISASGKSNVQEHGGGALSLILAATNVGAAATLTVKVETSRDGVTWYTAGNGATNSGQFTQVTSTVGTQNQYLGVVVDRFVRLDLTLGGTGTVDLAVTGELAL